MAFAEPFYRISRGGARHVLSNAKPILPFPVSSYSRTNPFPAPLVERRRLSLSGSEKETLHYELSLKGSGLGFEPGDSIGIFPTNEPQLVAEILKCLGAAGDELVPSINGGVTPLCEALLRERSITTFSRHFCEALEARCPRASELFGRKDDVHLINVLCSLPEVPFTIEEFVSLLPKLQPRLYSAASSLKRFPRGVDLLVSTVRYESHGRKRNGVCSTFLADRLKKADTVPVFVHTAKHFHLPEDDDAPMIMVGAGCGVAPYRGFLQERAARGARGRNWLFFGEQRRACDFYYEDEWAALMTSGVLTRIDTAFSRDQAQKIYVQDRMLEHAAELWSWFEAGAFFFVCGDVETLAPAVDAALHTVVSEQGRMKREDADEYIRRLRETKQYRRDVY